MTAKTGSAADEKDNPAQQDKKDDNTTGQPAAWSFDDEVSINSIEKIYQVFSASAKRWEAIVYPSLFAFILLAVYGFYLIYSLTTDVDKVVRQMDVISVNMVLISRNIDSMAQSVGKMTDSVNKMGGTLGSQLQEMHIMNKNAADMNKSLHLMNVSIYQMRRDMSMMNRNVSRPMNFMNSFMPW